MHIDPSSRRKKYVAGWAALLLLSLAGQVGSLVAYSSPLDLSHVWPLGAHAAVQTARERATTEGVYEECTVSWRASCLTRLVQIAAAGFDEVLNYDGFSGTIDDVKAYAAEASAAGVQLIWPVEVMWSYDGTQFSQYYPGLAQSCSCSDTSHAITYLVGVLKGLPATWGYYVGDEVASANHTKVKAFADLIHRLDPAHPRLFIGDAEAGNPVWQGDSPFYDVAEVIGDDHYPIGRAGFTVGSTAQVAEGIQRYADAHHDQAAIVLQAFSLAQYPDEFHLSNGAAACSPWPSCAPFPTSEQMQQMLQLALAKAHPRLVLWYSYYDVMRSNASAAHWQDLIEAAGVVARPPAYTGTPGAHP